MRGCACFKRKNSRCIQDDEMNVFIEKMMDAEGIIIASPTYFSNVSTGVKAPIERVGLVAIANDHLFKREVGAADLILPISSMTKSA